MSLSDLTTMVSDKARFTSLDDYIVFCQRYLEFAATGLQAVIISQNEHHYQFFQYRQDGNFNITRPLNSNLFYTAHDVDLYRGRFLRILDAIQDMESQDTASRQIIVRSIYTMQQCIGSALDALPAGKANTARKINGDLFERLIQLIIQRIGVHCETGTIQIPVEVDGVVQFTMRYQHDLLCYDADALKIIGSVKTSSKDRIDKVFLDKFLYSKLTDTVIPHIAIFLNDVQRKSTRKENTYSVSSTFLPGHFKGYTIKLNPLDGVYYCDRRPNMHSDPLLQQHIHTIDRLLCDDIWHLLKDTP